MSVEGSIALGSAFQCVDALMNQPSGKDSLDGENGEPDVVVQLEKGL